jgi:hypothetical protein
MTAEIESLVVEHLCAIRVDVLDIKERLTQVEPNLTAIGQQVGALSGSSTGLN